MLCADGPVQTLVGPAPAPEHRRGAFHHGLDHGRLNIARVRMALSALPLPRAVDGRLVLAVDVSPWLRPTRPPCRDARSATPTAGARTSIG
ncbi:transposase [Nonomuraea roseola]|uniref:Transposase n=1 Tax=Nonomuraea roseola TaxID=46179 RepID=A0ABV5QDN0_9ACTN